MPLNSHKRLRPPARPLAAALAASLALLAPAEASGQDAGARSSVASHAASAPMAAATGPVAAPAALSGVVVDEAEAAVSGALVTLRDSAGRVSAESRTSDVGRFLVARLPAGSYTLTARLEGFSTTEVRDLRLKADERLLVRVPLRTGQLLETVTVEAAASVVNETPDVGTSVSRRMAENLPLGGRSLQPLINLTPGVVPVRPSFAGQGQFSAGGQRAGANYFVVDGVSANIGVAVGADGLGQSGAGALPPFGALGTTHALLTADSLQELRVITGSYAAEYGRTPGAQVLIQTRAGTNRWRAVAYEYFRHGALDARDWFANSHALAVPPLSNQNFGGTLGGPVVRNRTFLFASYEGVRARLPAVGTFDVPALEARAAAPEGVRPFLEAFPVPNGRETTNGLDTFTGAYADTASVDGAGLRLDQHAGARLALFARYSYAGSDASTRGVYSAPNNILRMEFETHAATFGATYTATRGAANELRVGYGRTTGAKHLRLDDFGGGAPPDARLMFPDFASPADSIFVLGLGGGAAFSVGRDSATRQRQLNVVDNFSFSRGSHLLKFGADYRRLTPTYGNWPYKQIVYFDGVAGALTGTASSGGVGAQESVELLFTNFSVYAQDTWKVGPRLSLTYGLRWEYVPPPTGRGREGLRTVRGFENASTLALAPPGTPFYETAYTNFAPRFGAAYRLPSRHGWERVLRGGFGVYYDLGTGALANAATSFPHERVRLFMNAAYPLSAEMRLPPASPLDVPALRVYATDPRLKTPLTLQWNVSVEQALGERQSVTASYVGAAGRRLLRMEMLYAPTPDFYQVFVTTNASSSDYRALQLQFQRRFTRGLQTLVSYTFARSEDDASNDWSPAPPGVRPDARRDRGPSDFDVRHGLAAAVTYDLPAPRASLFGEFGRALFGGWSVDQILAVRSAPPVEVYYTRDFGFGPLYYRPDAVAGQPFYIEDAASPGGRRLNRAAFAVPAEMRQGTFGRNRLRGFPFAQLDLSLRRRFALTERAGLQLRLDLFNVFNRPNFADPLGDLGSASFGRSVSTLGRSLNNAMGSVGLNHAYQAGGARALQLSLKLGF
jgi:outer membrane receptor protein involved in Fe transport